MAQLTKNGKQLTIPDRQAAVMIRSYLLGKGDVTTEQLEQLMAADHLAFGTRLRSALQNGVRLGVLFRVAPGVYAAG